MRATFEDFTIGEKVNVFGYRDPDSPRVIDALVLRNTSRSSPVPRPTTPSITILVPNGGETYQQGADITFGWSQNYRSVNLMVHFFDYNTGTDYYSSPISGGIGKNAGVLRGEVVNVPAGQYRITICDEGTPNPTVTFKPLCDSSDAPFSIGSGPTPPPPTTGGSLSVALDANSPGYQIVYAGQTNVELLRLRFNGTGEDIDLKQIALQLSDTERNTPNDLVGRKVTLWDGATKIGEAVFPIGDTAISSLIQTGSFRIPRDSSRTLIVRGDVAAVTASGPLTQSGDLLKVDFDGDNKGLNGTYGVGGSSAIVIAPIAVPDTASAGVRIFKAYPRIAYIPLTNAEKNLSTGITEDKTLYKFAITAQGGDVSLYKHTFSVQQRGASISSDVHVYPYLDSSFSQQDVSFLSTSVPILEASGDENLYGIYFGAKSSYTIPAGQTRYFRFAGRITNLQGTGAITVSLLGDAAYIASANIATALAVESDPNNDFIWSGNSTTTASSLFNFDWSNGYSLPGLPPTNTTPETIGTGSGGGGGGGDLPDLVVSDLRITPAEPIARQEATLKGTVINRGTLRADNIQFTTDLGFQAVHHALPDNSCTNGAALTPNGVGSCVLSLGVTYSTPIERNSVVFSVDPSNRIPESNETNNTQRITFNIVTATTTQPSITVISPNGGEVWSIGSTQTIRWVSNSLPVELRNSIHINVFVDGATNKAPISSDLLDDGIDSWTIPSYLLPGSYRIEVEASKGTFSQSYRDVSDAPFSIVSGQVSSPALAVTLDSSSPGAKTVTAGTNNAFLTTIRLSASGGDVELRSVNIGSDSPDAVKKVGTVRVVGEDGKVLASGQLVQSINNLSERFVVLSPFLNIPKDASKRINIQADIPSSASGSVRLGLTRVYVGSQAIAQDVSVFGAPVTIVPPVVAVPLYRIYISSANDHFYTTSSDERQSVIRTNGLDEGVIGNIYPTQVAGSVLLYRLYLKNGEHLYTTSADEKDSLVRTGETFEGTVGYVFLSGSEGIRRMYNGSLDRHILVKDGGDEQRSLLNQGWTNEGVFYLQGASGALRTSRQVAGILASIGETLKRISEQVKKLRP